MKFCNGILLSGLLIERDGSMPMYRQLYLQLRKLILSQHLSNGTRLPSTRTLCKELNLSRITVMNAFDQLRAEGFLDMRAGSGAYISNNWQRSLPKTQGNILSTIGQSILSSRSDHFSGISYPTWDANAAASFLPNQIGFDVFPHHIWKRLLGKHATHPSREQMDYGDLQGLLILRQAIAEYVYDARGIACDASQIIVVSGAQQAFNILGMLLVNPGEHVWMEDPGHIAARVSLQSQGCHIVPVPVDEQGMNIDYGMQVAPDARLAYTTPARQHPLCVSMSTSRREALLHWARDKHSWIIEDDCDSEFCYREHAPMSLYGQDDSGRVIHVGSFSKVLYPSLRLGYVIVPKSLIEPFCAVRAVMDRSPPTLLQEVTADFMRQGHFLRHVRYMRSLYQKRQQCVLNHIQSMLGHEVECAEARGGLHLLVWLPSSVDDAHIASLLREENILTYALSDYCIEHRLPPALLIGFAGIPQLKVPELVGHLSISLKRLLD